MAKKLTKAQAGQLGGQSTLAKHGNAFFQRIGKAGARVTWSRYRLIPTGLQDFAMVNKQTGEVKAFLSGRPW